MLLLYVAMGSMVGLPLPAFFDPHHNPLHFALAQLALLIPIVVSGYRKGLLLPNLEGVDTVEEQVKIAKRKAGNNFPLSSRIDARQRELMEQERMVKDMMG